MQELTEKQTEIYNFIQNYIQKHGYSPSREEIADGLNIHRSTARGYLIAMKKKSALTWDERVARSFVLTKGTSNG